MPKLTPLQIGFLIANTALGVVLGVLHARMPAFQASAIPLFGWLVAGVLLLDLAFGWIAGAHPTTVVSMPVRIAALVLSYLGSLAVMSSLIA